MELLHGHFSHPLSRFKLHRNSPFSLSSTPNSHPFAITSTKLYDPRSQKHSITKATTTVPILKEPVKVERERDHKKIIPVERGRDQKPAVVDFNSCFSLLQNNNLAEARQAHAFALKMAIYTDPRFQNKLLVIYAQNSCVNDAEQVFNSMLDRNAMAYASLIGLYCKHGQWIRALRIFALMVAEGIFPDKFLLPTIFKACSGLESLKMGKEIHGFLIRFELELDLVMSNSLIDMYAKCGSLDDARKVFDRMDLRDVVSWTSLISSYSELGLMDLASDCFESMELSGITPDLIAWNSLISGFSQLGDLERARQLLGEMRGRGLKPGVNSWNGIISGCVKNGFINEALHLFCEMQAFEIPNSVTISSILGACSDPKALKLGKEIHGYANKHGFYVDLFVEGSLINMYLKCKACDYAQRVFATIEKKNSAIWNEMISGYVNQGKMEEALEIMHQMVRDGVKPDAIACNTLLAGYAKMGQKEEAFKLFRDMGSMGLKPDFVSINLLIAGFQQAGLAGDALKLFHELLKPGGASGNVAEAFDFFYMEAWPNEITISSVLSACADLKLKLQGKEIHGYLLRKGFQNNVFVSSALVHMYSKCEDMCSSSMAFYMISDKNTVCWNSLLAGYNQNGKPNECMSLFLQMLEDGLFPSSITMLILLSACSDLLRLRLGSQIHGYSVKLGFSGGSATLASSIINMYARCGSVINAEHAFDLAMERDVAVWNAMVVAYAMHGMTHEAMTLFEEMQNAGFKPNHITLIAILCACSTGGLVEQGWEFFKCMKKNYGVVPTLEHYTCMVDIMGGAGLLKEALNFINKMPYEPDACVWGTLLRACRMHSNISIGEQAAKALFALEPNNASNYIMLSNIYAMTGMWNSARDVREAIIARGLAIEGESSSIEIGLRLHEFRAGNNSYENLDEILETWGRLATEMEEGGYVPRDPILWEEDEREFDQFSCFHTEKLAICLGLVALKGSNCVRIVKSLRMCIDCHTCTKLLSRIKQREVMVNDGSCYHHFKDGKCSCGDRW